VVLVEGKTILRQKLGRLRRIEGRRPECALGAVDRHEQERVSRARPALRNGSRFCRLADAARERRGRCAVVQPLPKQVLRATRVGREHDFLSVGGPDGVTFVAGIRRQPARDAAGNVDQPQVELSVFVGDFSNGPRAIG